MKRVLLLLVGIAFFLAAGASVYSLWYVVVSHTSVNPVFFPWICIPVALTAAPFKRLYLIGPVTVAMIAFLFAPFSMSIGLFYEPAILVMLLTTVVDLGSRIYGWLRNTAHADRA